MNEEQAREKMSAEPYKIEILDGILAKDPNAPITIYHIGAPLPYSVRLRSARLLCKRRRRSASTIYGWVSGARIKIDARVNTCQMIAKSWVFI